MKKTIVFGILLVIMLNAFFACGEKNYEVMYVETTSVGLANEIVTIAEETLTDIIPETDIAVSDYALMVPSVLLEISVKTNPTKSTYYVGELLDTSGLSIMARYSDGSSKVYEAGIGAPKFNCTPQVLTTVGNQIVTVKLGGKTTTFNVNVTEMPEEIIKDIPVVIEFKDQYFEKAVRDALGIAKESITSKDMERLTKFTLSSLYSNANHSFIENIDEIEYAVNLTELDISINKISDISVLANLTNLTKLVLHSDQIIDISPLTNLTSLTELNLKSNKIIDISPLSDLTNLNSLRLYGCVTDVSALTNLTNLTKLVLQSDYLSDISPLAKLENLIELDISGNDQISDINPLANLTNLIKLDLSNNRISDIASLASLKNLIELDISGNQISDISALSNLISLSKLDLSHQKSQEIYCLRDISPLVNLKNLTELDLSGNVISDIRPLLNLTNLTNLKLSGNYINAWWPVDHIADVQGRPSNYSPF